MKKCSWLINLFVAALISLVGLVFLFLEGRLLLSGDWLLHEMKLLAFFQYLFKTALAAFCLLVGIRVFIKKDKCFLFESIVILAACVAMAPFITNGFPLYFIALATVFILSNLFVFLGKRRA